ncbi:hypothetical protein L4C32_00740 [Aliivibrio kagoshimensis]
MPNLGRWLNRDPLQEAGGINLYAYVNGDPMGYVDPDGRYSVTVGFKSGWGGKIKLGWSDITSRPFIDIELGAGLYAGLGVDPLDNGKGKGGCKPNMSLGYNYNLDGTFGPYGKEINAGAEIDMDGNITVNDPDISDDLKLNALNVNKGISAGGGIGIVISYY